MNISKFTQKSVEAVQNCEKLAYEYGRLQVFVHIKRRTLERNIFFPLVKREILEETAFPKEVRHQYVKTYIVQGTVLLA